MKLKVKKAKWGTRFTFVSRGGLRKEYKVEKPCKGKVGLWYCVSHGQLFEDQFEKDKHILEGEHELAWICGSHGPEEP